MSSTESFKERARDIVHEGNIRHVIVEKDGHRVVDLPLTLVVISALLAIWLVAILAAFAVVSGYEIRIEGPDSTDAAYPLPGDLPDGGDGTD
ncbi:MAG: DUF4342 domain-containing protein [Tepidiformaceae bacterium]